MPTSHAACEFDRQVQTYVDLGYPGLAGQSEEEFRALLEPVREPVLARADTMTEPTRWRVPFVLVIGKTLVPVTETIPLTALEGRPCFVSADTADDRFEPIESVLVPDPHAYAVFDVDRGKETLGVRPDDAIVSLTAQGRSPLTVDEGVAFITVFPTALEKNNCFQLLGSRCGDRRVPGLWISDRRPKLGFCWAGNLHTWLGAASCADRASSPASAGCS